jgi:hypothetical protein
MKSSEIVGQQIIDLAKEKNVDLKKFPEVQTAMGYDKNGGNLTAAELGAFMVGVAQQNGTKMSQTGKVTSPKKDSGGFADFDMISEVLDATSEA